MGRDFKRPVSVLVVIHTPDLQVLLLERVTPPGFWQSVTGSLEDGETPDDCARREVAEETGFVVPRGALIDCHRTNRFAILPAWRHRYAPGVTENVEHVFTLNVPEASDIRLAPGEHRAFAWLPVAAAAARATSWTNRDAILALPSRRQP